MSRSTKQPWVKDSNPNNKRIQNRRYRRYVRQEIKLWRYRYWEHTEEKYCGICECHEIGLCPFPKQPIEPEFSLPHKYSDQYDVCDFRFYLNEPYYRRK